MLFTQHCIVNICTDYLWWICSDYLCINITEYCSLYSNDNE